MVSPDTRRARLACHWFSHGESGPPCLLDTPHISLRATINGIRGAQYTPGEGDYEEHRYQYALSSFDAGDRIAPGLIVYPANKDEIALTLQYAKAQNIAVAIRTGGHQYCGASSTVAPNIQLDLSKTFRTPDDLRYFEKDGKAFVRASVSHALGEFADFLGSHNAFVPHGQCINVHLGGHLQTGGYGMLQRSFGLLGDQVLSLEVVDHEGNFKEVTSESDPELFHAILGGSPGNLAVITHFTIKVYLDQDYPGSRGLKSLYWYTPETLKRLLDILVEMSDNDDFPGNYDCCVSVVSESFPILDIFHEDVDEKMKEHHPEIYGKDGIPFFPKTIMVYAQWVPFAETDVCDMSWFDRIRVGSLFDLPVKQQPMSELSKHWIFTNIREFVHPYVKSAQLTNSTTLAEDGWAEWVTGRIDEIVTPEANKCFLSAQMGILGGKHSKFVSNANNGTAYSWRDSRLCMVLDCFYEEGYKSIAQDWQEITHQEGIGANGKFCTQDRRLLWGSFGDYDLDKVWECYYDDRAKYERLGKARGKADPDGVLTPNMFCVARK